MRTGAHVVLPMALEGKVVARVAVMHVMNGDAPLDRAEAEALLIREARDTTALVLERGLDRVEDRLRARQVDDANLAL